MKKATIINIDYDYEVLAHSYRTYKEVKREITSFCNETGRYLVWGVELDTLYESHKRRDYTAVLVVTGNSVMCLTSERYRSAPCLYDYLDSNGIKEQAVLHLQHSCTPLFKQGYSIYILSRQGERLQIPNKD